MVTQDRWTTRRDHFNRALGVAGRSELLAGRCFLRATLTGHDAPATDADAAPVPWGRVVIVALFTAAVGIYSVGRHDSAGDPGLASRDNAESARPLQPTGAAPSPSALGETALKPI